MKCQDSLHWKFEKMFAQFSSGSICMEFQRKTDICQCDESGFALRVGASTTSSASSMTPLGMLGVKDILCARQLNPLMTYFEKIMKARYGSVPASLKLLVDKGGCIHFQSLD